VVGTARCENCGRVVGHLKPFYYGGENRDDHEDYSFVANDNFGGRCDSCGGLFCVECGEPGDWGRCGLCFKESNSWDDEGERSVDYDLFLRAAREFANHQISRSMFVLDWELAQKGGSVAVRRG
jgi:hypothetical protein